MKVLYYISKEADSVDIYHEMVASLRMHIPSATLIHSLTDIKKAYTDDNTELVHLFGCWNYQTAKYLFKAEQMNIPCIVSPLGGLQPWVLEQNKTQKFRQKHLFQHKMIRRASAIHLCGNLEAKTFNDLGWNPRTAVIKNSMLTTELSDEEMAEKMLQLYRKTLDSNATRLLTKPTQQTILNLLLAGIDGSSLKHEAFKRGTLDLLAQLSEENWRRIWLYAWEEDITEELQAGLEKIRFSAPFVDAGTIEKFPSKGKMAHGKLKYDALTTKNPMLKSKLETLAEKKYATEKRICTMIWNLRHEVNHQQATLRHLADIYLQLKFIDFDEDKLKEMLTGMDLKKFASHLMGCLQHTFKLTEGYMPLAASEGKDTDRLTQALTKFIQQ